MHKHGLEHPLEEVEKEQTGDDCFAADVSIEFEKMKLWSRDKLEKYFVDGG